MKRSLVTVICTLSLVGAVASTAFAQGTSILTGVVVDTGGGVVPGASITAKNNATTVESRTTTNTSGAFSIPSLPIGTYTVTATLSGFKTAVQTNVVLLVGSPADLKITMEVGTIEQRVEVQARSELVADDVHRGVVHDQGHADSEPADDVAQRALRLRRHAPRRGHAGWRRAQFDAVRPARAVDQHHDRRRQHAEQLPALVGRLLLDGVPAARRDRAGDGDRRGAGRRCGVSGGSTSIKFVTRSGTNQYRGAGYYYFRHPSLNTNYYFNEVNGLPKNRLILNQVGGSLGGPIKLPRSRRQRQGVLLRELRGVLPADVGDADAAGAAPADRGRVLPLHTGGGATLNEVNVLALAAANGHSSSFDPTVQALVAEIRRLAEATVPAGTGVLTDQNNVNLQQLVYQPPGTYYNHLPTTRVDFNLSASNRLSGSYWWQEINRYPDIQNGGEAQFPGLPNIANYTSVRSVGSVTLRSTLGSNLVNELIGGWQWSPGTFNSGIDAGQFANQDMYTLGFPLGATSATRSTNPNTRHQTNWNITNTHELAEGLAHAELRRRVHAHPPVERQHAGRPGHRLRHPAGARPGGHDVQHDELPGRVERQPQQRARALRIPRGPRDVGERHVALERGHQPVRVPGRPERARLHG